MRLIKKVSQLRRDFIGVYECEGCGVKGEISGYDDRNFHDNVAPDFKCRGCGESTRSLGAHVKPVGTRYAPWEVL